MKGDKFKIGLIYFLIVVILGLVCYLIYFILSHNNIEEPKTKEKKEKGVPEIASFCTFTLTNKEYHEILTGKSTLKICTGINKFVLTDLFIDNNQIDLQVIYYSNEQKSEKMGVYLKGKKIIDKTALGDRNNFGVFSNKLFIASLSDDVNIYAFNGKGEEIYNLKKQLSKLQINDPAFIEIAKTNPNFNTIIQAEDIDSYSLSFTLDSFNFSTVSSLECQSGEYKGSTYKVTYEGETFSAPEVLSINKC